MKYTCILKCSFNIHVFYFMSYARSWSRVMGKKVVGVIRSRLQPLPGRRMRLLRRQVGDWSLTSQCKSRVIILIIIDALRMYIVYMYLVYVSFDVHWLLLPKFSTLFCERKCHDIQYNFVLYCKWLINCVCVPSSALLATRVIGAVLNCKATGIFVRIVCMPIVAI